jgi:YkoY family integral membrane protein
MFEVFGLTVQSQDLATIGLLVFLEGILSIDNALAIAVIARRLPKQLQKKALTYGLAGAIIFRICALAVASYLMHWTWVKFVGGGYLVYVAVHHWITHAKHEEAVAKGKPIASFWKAVVIIELTDIAFAVDSILAAVAVTPKYWVVITGGVLGLIMMRFAAQIFIVLLNKFPNLETTAYLLVFTIGTKLVIDGFHFEGVNFHSTDSPAFWIFWASVFAFIVFGCIRPETRADITDELQALQKEADISSDLSTGTLSGEDSDEKEDK